MRIVLQGVRAVTVELMGVVLVLWLLFGCASWGLRSATGSTAIWNEESGRVLDRFQLAEAPPVASEADAERSAYAAQRLNYYAKLLSRLTPT